MNNLCSTSRGLEVENHTLVFSWWLFSPFPLPFSLILTTWHFLGRPLKATRPPRRSLGAICLAASCMRPHWGGLVFFCHFQPPLTHTHTHTHSHTYTYTNTHTHTHTHNHPDHPPQQPPTVVLFGSRLISLLAWCSVTHSPRAWRLLIRGDGAQARGTGAAHKGASAAPRLVLARHVRFFLAQPARLPATSETAFFLAAARHLLIYIHKSLAGLQPVTQPSFSPPDPRSIYSQAVICLGRRAN